LVKASGPGHDGCAAPLLTVRPPVTRIGQVDRKAPADDGGFVGENGIWAISVTGTVALSGVCSRQVASCAEREQAAMRR
jgi:hypothetical protein